MSVRSEMEWSIAGLIFRRLGGLVWFRHHPLVEVFAHLAGHLLHEPRHALGIALIEAAQAAGVGQRIDAGLFRFGGGDAGHESSQPITPAVLTASRFGIADASDEERGTLAAGVALIFINRHNSTSASYLEMLREIGSGRQPSSYYNGRQGRWTGHAGIRRTTGGEEHGHSDREPQRYDGPAVAGRNRGSLARPPGRAQRYPSCQDDPGEEPAS